MRRITISEWLRWGEADAWARNAAINHGRKMLAECEADLASAGLSRAEIIAHPAYLDIRARWSVLTKYAAQVVEIVADEAAALPQVERIAA